MLWLLSRNFSTTAALHHRIQHNRIELGVSEERPAMEQLHLPVTACPTSSIKIWLTQDKALVVIPLQDWLLLLPNDER